ncbi:MAG: DMT family transporter [Gammaproteobacteria bacterium]
MPITTRIPSLPLLPVFSCLLAATLWGIFWYPLRQMEALGVPGLWAILVVYIFASVAVAPWLWRQRAAFRQISPDLLVIGLAAGWCNLAFALAVLEGTVVRVLLLFYLAPMWTILLGIVILRERPGRQDGITLAIAMFGALIMLWPGLVDWSDGVSRADGFAITAGLAFALTNVMVRKAGDQPIALKMIAAWLGVLVLTVSAIILTANPFPVAATAGGWWLAALFGLFGMTLMTFTAQYGVTYLPIYHSAILFLFEVVAGAVSAWLLTSEVVTVHEWVGGSLVMLAAWLSARASRQI